jgi:hypothetical protein
MWGGRRHDLIQVSKMLGDSTFTPTPALYGDNTPEDDGGAAKILPERPAHFVNGARIATNAVKLVGSQSIRGVAAAPVVRAAGLQRSCASRYQW